MNKQRLNWWCDRAWIKCMCLIAAVMLGLIMLNWEKWSTELKIIAAIAALIPVHVLEEWIFPGGFHYQYNTLRRSNQLDRYPMNRLSDMYTNMMATVFYIILTIISIVNGQVSNGMILGTTIFCALELIVHTLLGIIMYSKFRTKGKTTIYGPGSITTYIGFVPFGVILLYVLKERTIISTDWIGAASVVGFILIICILLPEVLFMKKGEYYFKNNGYYDRF